MTNFLLLLINFIMSFIFALTLTPLAVRIAGRYKLVDQPNNLELKIHNKPVPIIGGIIIFTSMFLAIIISDFILFAAQFKFFVILIACFILLLVGVIDDFTSLPPFIRLMIQILVSIWVVHNGFKFDLFSVDILNVIATVIFIVTLINSINLLDGMDGLATGVSAVSSVALFILAFLQNNIIAQIFSITLLGSLVGFLLYNFYPAKIFLGDNGSNIIGFLLALLVVSISSSQNNSAYFGACILILGLPLFDTSLAILRRIRVGKNIFSGDREHFYDKLLTKGYNQKETALIGYGLSIICSGLGISILVFLIS